MDFDDIGPIFEAQFDSDCERCTSRIKEGDDARMVGPGQAVHDKCPPEPPKRPACPHCFLVHGTAQEECD